MRDKVFGKINEYKVSDALEELWGLFRKANQYIDKAEPWNLNKDGSKRERLSTVLYNLLETLNIGANLLIPFMPESANKILNELNVAERNYADLDKFGLTENYKVTKEPQILFNRVSMQDIQPTIDEIVAKQKAENAPVIEFKQADLITIDDFAKIQMKVGTVIDCEAVPKSKLLHSTVKVGTATLSILSGIAKAYTPEQMIGKKLTMITNLKPAKLCGIVSEGMILCAENEQGKLAFLMPENDIEDGSQIF